MTLTIELSTEKERALQVEAVRLGVPVEECALEILARNLVPASIHASARANAAEDTEFEAAMDDFSAGTGNLPPLPPEANSRVWIYAEHD